MPEAKEDGDEAQTMGSPSSPKAATPVESFRIELFVGASVEVNGKDWMKTGANGAHTWKSIPTATEIRDMTRFIQGTLLRPAVEEMLTEMGQSLLKKQQNT